MSRKGDFSRENHFVSEDSQGAPFMVGIIKFIQDNFMHVAPILLTGALGIAITLDRVYALLFLYPMGRADQFFEKVRNLIMADRVNEAILLCERYRMKPIANVVREGLVRAHQPENLIEHGLQVAVGEAQERIQARTAFLATIANVATLLGLLGTIIGLIQSFEAVGNANAQQRSALLAQGISTAMNATMLGLGVAIPCMVIYSFLMSRTNKMNGTVERSAIKILDLLKQRYYKAGMAVDEFITNAGVGLKPHHDHHRDAAQRPAVGHPSSKKMGV